MTPIQMAKPKINIDNSTIGQTINSTYKKYSKINTNSTPTPINYSLKTHPLILPAKTHPSHLKNLNL